MRSILGSYKFCIWFNFSFLENSNAFLQGSTLECNCRWQTWPRHCSISLQCFVLKWSGWKEAGLQSRTARLRALTVALFSLDVTGPVLSKARGGSPRSPVRLGLLPELSSAHKREEGWVSQTGSLIGRAPWLYPWHLFNPHQQNGK